MSVCLPGVRYSCSFKIQMEMKDIFAGQWLYSTCKTFKILVVNLIKPINNN